MGDEEMKQSVLTTPSDTIKYEEMTETIVAQKGSKEVITSCSSKTYDFGHIDKTESEQQPLQVAISLNLNVSDNNKQEHQSKSDEDDEDDDTDEENVTNQDVEYERSFIKDLSVNPFGANLFGTKKETKD